MLQFHTSHERAGMFAVAAILVGGASVSRATIADAIVGTILFHALFFVSPFAGKNLLVEPQIEEFFRVFIPYGIIAVSLILHSFQKRLTAENRRKSLIVSTRQD